MAHQKIHFVRLQQQIDRHEFRALEKYRRNLPRRMRGALRIIDSTTIAFSDSRFFKWLKQNLKMRRMLGFSENAVQLQIGAARPAA